MKFLLISVGSRGDAEPFASTAAALLKNGHSVEIFFQKDLQHLAPPEHERLKLHALPFTQMDFYVAMANVKHGVDHPSPRVKFIGIIAETISSLVLPCHEMVAEAAASCDWLVCSSLARALCIAITEKLNKKLAIVHLQPLTPTTFFPHTSDTEECVDAIADIGADGVGLVAKEENQAMYFELERFQHEFISEALTATYDALGIAAQISFDELKEILIGKHERIHLVHGFSNEYVPSIKNDTTLGPNVHEIGALADDYLPSSFSGPPPDLVEFLKTCETADVKPVCIGFGSMPFETAAVVLDAVHELGNKTVLVGDALKIPDDYEHKGWMSDNVCQVSSIPYSWLLPKCSMMLSHGGAGVLHACGRTGIPTLIAPLLGDQFFHAALVEKRGTGVKCTAVLPTLTKEEIVNGVRKGEGCKEAAKRLGERIVAAGSGVDKLVDVLTKST